MRRHRAALALAAICLSFACALQALAQGGGQGTSIINPFPKGDIYRLHLVGDWYAEGMQGALAELLSSERQIQLQRKVIQVRSLRRETWDYLVETIENAARSTPIDIAVVMFGAAEIGSLRVPGRRRVRFATEEWKAQYVIRVDRVMKALKRNRTAIYWLGMPTLRRSDRNDGAQFLNEIFRERAYINGIRFIDTYTGFADEAGGYSRYGPDLTGKIRLLRSRDGMYFTAPGYLKLAHYAERAIRRDLRRAKSERTVPLAGSELEQRRINPRESPAAEGGSDDAERPVRRAPIASRIGSSTISAPTPVPTAPGVRDQAADNSTIALRVIENGVARTEKVEIVRPAVSATVLALLTRKHSTSRAARLGDNVAVELPGGITVLSSVTPVDRGPALGGRGRRSPTQSPYFKVWAKGERLTPRSGRADDIQWPRPEPRPVVRAKFVPPGTAPDGSIKLTPDGFPPLPEPNPRVPRR